MGDWLKGATRVTFASAGPYVGGKPRLVWHTTETKSLPAYDGTQPHVTFNPRTGELWQHQPFSQAAKALVHGTVETNRQHAIQVELICYSDENVAKSVGGLAVVNFTDADYARINKLARRIERATGVARKCTVNFKHYPESAGASNGVRMSDSAWLGYSGHCGHQHVPSGNVHGDPSSLKIEKILSVPPPWKIVANGDVLFRGTLREIRVWIKGHAAKIKKLKGINIRPR